MKKTIASLVVLVVLGLFAPTVHADSFLIDHFTQPSTGQQVNVTGNGTVSDTATGLTEVAGGARTMELTVTGSQFGNTSSLALTASGVGMISMSNDSGQIGVGRVIWDAAGAGLGGLDITNGGSLPYLQATILDSDQNLGFQVEITETAAAGGSTATWTTDLGAGASYVNEALSNFTNATNVDFTHVNKIVLILTGPFAQDGTLDLLEVTNTPTPEPLTVSMLGLGGLGLLLRRRRRHS